MMSAKCKRLLASAVLTAALLAVFGYFVLSEISYARLKDPTGIARVADFYERFGASSLAIVVHLDETQYLYLTGPLPPKGSLAQPSSPPVYVFDQQGLFVDWCSDPGDTPSWDRAWPTTGGTRLSDVEVCQRFPGTRSSR